VPTTAAKSLELWSPPVQGVMDAAWTWREGKLETVGINFRHTKITLMPVVG
jgi:hypothetical protein